MSTQPDRPTYDRPFVDYGFEREVAAHLRLAMVNRAVLEALFAAVPSRQRMRNLGLALLVATGAFWVIMFNNPPITVAADPTVAPKAFTPLNLPAPLDLPIGVAIKH
jgi:hypothetical protein